MGIVRTILHECDRRQNIAVLVAEASGQARMTFGRRTGENLPGG